MKTKITAALLAWVFFSSCQKDVSDESYTLSNGVTASGAGGTLPGGGTNTSTTNQTNCKACNYYPICSGSVYNYSDTSAGSSVGVASNYTLTYVKDTTIENKIYQKIKGAGQQNTYFNCTAGVSTTIVLNGTTTGGTTLPYVKITTLKSNEPVGASYSDIISNAGQDAVYTYTIVSKGNSRTVAGKTYADVIHVKEQTTIDFLGNITPAGKSEYYFAKGVGLIESISFDDFNGGAQILHHVLINATIP
jgi:hypothetical protein